MGWFQERPLRTCWFTAALLGAVMASSGCSDESTTAPKYDAAPAEFLSALLVVEIEGEEVSVAGTGYKNESPLEVSAQLRIGRPLPELESTVTVIKHWVIVDGRIIACSLSGPDSEHEAKVVDEWVRLLWFATKTQMRYRASAEFLFVFEVTGAGGVPVLVRSSTTTLIDPVANKLPN
jgi:hypothetical protein